MLFSLLATKAPEHTRAKTQTNTCPNALIPFQVPCTCIRIRWSVSRAILHVNASNGLCSVVLACSYCMCPIQPEWECAELLLVHFGTYRPGGLEILSLFRPASFLFDTLPRQTNAGVWRESDIFDLSSYPCFCFCFWVRARRGGRSSGASITSLWDQWHSGDAEAVVWAATDSDGERYSQHGAQHKSLLQRCEVQVKTYGRLECTCTYVRTTPARECLLRLVLSRKAGPRRTFEKKSRISNDRCMSLQEIFQTKRVLKSLITYWWTTIKFNSSDDSGCCVLYTVYIVHYRRPSLSPGNALSACQYGNSSKITNMDNVSVL